MSRKRMLRFALALLATTAGVAHAITYTWPGGAPCNGTLQACIDAAATGARIEVAAATIAEDISLYDQDRTLAPAPGFTPAFGPGHWLSITSSALSGDRSVAVSGFSFTDGYVFASYRGSGTANYDLHALTLTRAGSNTANTITVQAESGTVNATVCDNRLLGTRVALNDGAIALRASGGTLDAYACYNVIRAGSADSGSDDGSGILADYQGSGGTVRLHGNEVRGNFGRDGLFVSEGRAAGPTATVNARVFNNVVVGNGADFGGGIGLIAGSGTIHATVAANTITRVGAGVSTSQWAGGGAGAAIDGTLSSNLLRVNLYGIIYSVPAVATGLTNDYNLVNTDSVVTPTPLGPHTITADARLVSDLRPRLRGNSPAIDAADTNTVGLGMLFAGLPYLDADGLRRMKTWFALDKIDIGAYEYGDAGFAHVATALNTAGHVTYVHDPAINGVTTAHLQVTQNYSLRAVSFAHPFGSWLNGSDWTVFAEDFTALPVGLGFDVFSPAPGDGAFRHAADASNISGWQTRIDDTSVNDLPDQMLFVTQDYGASTTYNAHDVGVGYAATSASTGDWYIVNLDHAAMPAGAGFSVYAQVAGPNAFRVTKVAGIGDNNKIPLDHPLLDGIACAQPIVTRVDGGSAVAGGHFDVYYDSGRWLVFGYEAGGIAPGTQFNVLVNPAQVATCTDVIFANGFD